MSDLQRWNSEQKLPDNDRLVLAFAPGISDPEDLEPHCKHVWMGHWNTEDQKWYLLVPGYGSSLAATQAEVTKWTEIPVPNE